MASYMARIPLARLGRDDPRRHGLAPRIERQLIGRVVGRLHLGEKMPRGARAVKDSIKATHRKHRTPMVLLHMVVARLHAQRSSWKRLMTQRDFLSHSFQGEGVSKTERRRQRELF